jgi:lysozyme
MEKSIKASERCFELVKHFEGCKLKAYKDSAGIWTIAIGCITYPNGNKVKQGDTCTTEQAKEYFLNDIKEAEKKLTRWLSDFNQKYMDQYRIDALLSIVFNVGYPETLIKKVNTNPNDTSIWGAFLLYVKAGGKIVKGLVRRRNSEAFLYFKNDLHFFEEMK